MLRVGSRGPEVLAWQQFLADSGYDVGTLDGIFGPKTAAATKAYQSYSNITADGIVGPNTRAAQTQATGEATQAPAAPTPEPEQPKNTTTVATTGANTAGAGTGVSATSGSGTSGAESAGTSQQGVGGGGPDPATQLTILTGKQMVWSFDEVSGKWYVAYGLPNSNTWAVFEAEPDQMDMLFGIGKRPVAYEAMPGGLEGLLQRPGRFFSGNIGEMEGTGSLEDEVKLVTTLALDDGVLPEWAKGDMKAQDLLYVAQMEQKSPAWLVEQLSNLESFKARFPGIKQWATTQNLTLTEAISGYRQFEGSIRTALKAAGFNEASLTPTVVGGLLNQGYSIESASTSINTFKRMKDFAPALGAFNEILAAKGLPSISTQEDFFRFVSGAAPAVFYDTYEASSIQQAAETAGLGSIFSSSDAIRAALETDQTLDTATKSMQQAAQLLLRLRNEVDVGMFGLNHEELIDISLGQRTRSGRTEAEVNDSIQRAVATAQGFLATKAKPFTGFTQQGTPQAASLGSLRQSG